MCSSAYLFSLCGSVGGGDVNESAWVIPTRVVGVVKSRGTAQVKKMAPQWASCHNLIPMELNVRTFLNAEEDTNLCSKLNNGTVIMILVNYHESFL